MKYYIPDHAITGLTSPEDEKLGDVKQDNQNSKNYSHTHYVKYNTMEVRKGVQTDSDRALITRM